MRVNRFRSIRSLALAVGIHVLAIGLLIVSLELTPPPAGQPQGDPTDRTEVVQAVTVDEHKVKAEVERLEQAERRERDRELARRRTAERELAAAKAKRQVEERRLAEVKKEKAAVEKAKAAEQKELVATEAKRKQEEAKRRQEEERRAALEKQRLEEEKRKQAKAEAEKERQAAEAKAAAAKKREEAEAAAEKKRKETEARAEVEKKRQEAEAKAEAEKKRQEEERRARELAQQMEAEEQAARDQSEIDRFTLLIKTRIENAFTNPQSGLSCTLVVKMVPGGDVVDAKVVRSSGNVAFDRQAERAVHKASPLPVPDDPRLFQQMREIQFIFDPQA